MKLLDHLYDLGLYVSDEDEIKHFISQHPEVIDDLSYVENLIKALPHADFLLCVDDGAMVLDIGIKTYKDYIDAIKLLSILIPITNLLQIEIRVPFVNDAEEFD